MFDRYFINYLNINYFAIFSTVSSKGNVCVA